MGEEMDGGMSRMMNMVELMDGYRCIINRVTYPGSTL